MTAPLVLPSYVAGRPVSTAERIEVRNPFTGRVTGTVASVGRREVEEAVAAGRASTARPRPHERHAVLLRARDSIEARREEFALLISSETGLSLRDTRHEVTRALDVLHFAAMEALHDVGDVLSADVSPHGKARKIFTLREPHALVAAITPFNHPLNQVLHKVAPAVACGAPVVLKPSERTPLTAIRCAEVLYEAGLPRDHLSVLLGPASEVAEVLVAHSAVEVVSFTGSVAVGKRIAATAGYKKVVLELGGNCPLLVLEDADLDLAARLAAEGSFRNSGQRCTAVNRILVEEGVLAEFTKRLTAQAREYTYGDPLDAGTNVGTVINAESAARIEGLVEDAVRRGARVLRGGRRERALVAPAVVGDAPRDADLVRSEVFGPIATVVEVRDLADAIGEANATPYGLSAGVVTRSLERAIEAVKGIRAGTVNVNEVPGFRTESSPFGGVKDSGLGIKEGVVEAIKWMTTVKTFSLPW